MMIKIMPIVVFVNISDKDKPTTNSGRMCSQYADCERRIYDNETKRFPKYLVMLLVEYSTFRINMCLLCDIRIDKTHCCSRNLELKGCSRCKSSHWENSIQ